MERRKIIIVYSVIIIITVLFSYLLISNSKNKLSSEEKNIYETLLVEKKNFKNPDAIKVVYVKYCNDDYSIVEITGDNSFGGPGNETYFKNKKTLYTDNNVEKIVSEECFKNEMENYDKVKILSKDALERINNKLKGDKK